LTSNYSYYIGQYIKNKKNKKQFYIDSDMHLYVFLTICNYYLLGRKIPILWKSRIPSKKRTPVVYKRRMTPMQKFQTTSS